jgi:hypothetical protein
MTWQRINLGAPEFERPTEPPQTCGILYGQGKRHAFSGPPESLKTVVAHICGLEHTRAGHGGYAVIDLEMGEHATRLLLDELGYTLEEIAAVYYVAAEGPPDDADIQAIKDAGVTLVTVDAAAGAYDVSGLDDNKRSDAEMFARAWVKPLWNLGIATVLLDHVVKNSDSRGRYAIGSERKLGGVDVHLGLEAVKALHRGAEGIVKITTHKDRPGHLERPHPAELHLSSDPDTHHITWVFAEPSARQTASDEWKPTWYMEQVSRVLEKALPETMNRGDVVTAIGRNRKFVLDAINALIAEHHVAEKKGAHGAKLLTSLQPFRVPEPFQAVPENADPLAVPAVPPPLGGNGTRNGLDPEVERLADLAREMGQT